MFTKTTLEELFTEMGNICIAPASIVLCGGASMLLNYGNRECTEDVDCIDTSSIAIDTATLISLKRGLNQDWLNTNVCATQSYSNELYPEAVLYKTYDKLMVYTIKGLALFCMKLVSWRPNSNDYDDCKYLVSELRNNYDILDVYSMIEKLYGSSSVLSVDAEKFLKYEFSCDDMMLDSESITSLIYSINAGLHRLEELPLEIQRQIKQHMRREKVHDKTRHS